MTAHRLARLGLALALALLAGCTRPGRITPLAPTGSPTQTFSPAAAEVALIPQSQREPAPSFELTLLDGRKLSLHDLKGHPTILNFWGTWCPPCVKEAPDLEATYKQYRERGLQVVGVGVDDTPATMRKGVKKLQLTYPNGPSDEMAAAWRVRYTPTTFFLDAQGRIAGQQVGGLERQSFRAWAEALLREAGG